MDGDSDQGTPVEDEENEKKISCVLDANSGDTLSPGHVALEVEGRRLHAHRSVLAHYSPVFAAMLFSDFKEKSDELIPLPGKTYADMAVFFNVMWPGSPSAESQITDDNLLSLLALADEYQVDHVKMLCQGYIGAQLSDFHFRFYDYYTSDKCENRRSYCPYPRGDINGQVLSKQQLLDKMMLNLQACAKYGLGKHKEDIFSLVVTLCDGYCAVESSKFYSSLSSETKIELLEVLCKKFKYY